MSAAVHFLYEPEKEPNAAFAESLIREWGQVSVDTADTIVSVGGDGLLLRALRDGAGKAVCGIAPPGTNSRGFWTNRGVAHAQDLKRLFETAQSYPVRPLKAHIRFADGSDIVRYGYNDISVKNVYSQPAPALQEQFGLSSIDVSVQSSLLNLRVSFANAAIGPYRIMGTGLVFATPLGSTAMSRNYGGPSIDIRENAIIMTGIGITEPPGGFQPVVNNGGVFFDIEIGSPAKRPVIVTFDSFGVIRNESGSPVQKITVSAAQEKTASLLLGDDPGTRVYSSFMPQGPV